MRWGINDELKLRTDNQIIRENLIKKDELWNTKMAQAQKMRDLAAKKLCEPMIAI